MDKPMEQMLREYRSNRDEIVELQQKLRELPGSESLIGNSVVLDYRRGYPQPRLRSWPGRAPAGEMDKAD